MVALMLVLVRVLVDVMFTPIAAASGDAGLQIRAGLHQTIGQRDVRGAVAVGLFSTADTNPILLIRGTRVQADGSIHRLAFELSFRSNGAIVPWRVDPLTGERLQVLEHGDERPMLMVAGITEREVVALVRCVQAPLHVDKRRRAIGFDVAPGGQDPSAVDRDGSIDGPSLVRASLVDANTGIRIDFAGSSGDAVVTWTVQPVSSDGETAALDLKIVSRAGLGRALWHITRPVHVRGGRGAFFADNQWSGDAAVMEQLSETNAVSRIAGRTER